MVHVAYPGIIMLDLAGPAEVFAAANRFAESGPRYRSVVASVDGRPLTTNSGLQLGVDTRLSSVTGRVDTLRVVSGLTHTEAMQSEELLAEVRRMAGRARRVTSTCVGAFVLAAAGLLDGRTATTHWAFSEDLARAFPEVTVEPDRIFVQDGNVYTSAGATAGMDLALALVEEDHGVEVARAAARWLVLFMQRPGGQSQFSERLTLPIASDSALRVVCDEVVSDPGGDHSVPRLAGRAALSERHLARLFMKETGTTPARFVERTRVEAARALLEAGPTPTGTIAQRVGFGCAETMRRAFLRVLGIGPADYRARSVARTSTASTTGSRADPPRRLPRRRRAIGARDQRSLNTSTAPTAIHQRRSRTMEARDMSVPTTPSPTTGTPRDAARPPITDRVAFQAELDRLRPREKAHTREGDAIAAARRRLPMVEIDPRTPLTGPGGPVPLIDVFDGRSQLIAYYHMWHPGRPAAEQCEGCTFNTSHVTELAYLHSRDVSYAVFAEGPYGEASRYRDFMGYPVPWYSVPPGSIDRLIAGRYFGIVASYLRDGGQVFETYWTSGRGNEVMAPSYALLDRTPYGRQETWEDSPEGWPQRWGSLGGQFQLDGRPTAQWPRIRAGRDDDLGPIPDPSAVCSCELHTTPPAGTTD